MDSAQKLFESGKITYHRTDSTNISVNFLNEIKTYIISTYSSNYYKSRNYKTKIKCAQEAHEAIRPTDVNLVNLIDDFGPNEKKIYSLIWKRTIASQMADASFNTITVNIENSKRSELFNCYGEECTFDGFLKVYSFQGETDETDTIPESAYNILDKLNGPVKIRRENDVWSRPL